MRSSLTPGLTPSTALACAAVLGLIAPATAADLAAPAPAYSPPVQPLSFVSELRIGGSAQDPWSPERNTFNVNGEILFARPGPGLDRFWSAFVPRPTAGFSINTGGKTSYGYAGATWTVDVTDRVFVDAFFGGAVHDGATGPKAFIPLGRNALGCSPLFREAAGLGYRLTASWSVMATIEHMSNAGFCVENRGLTNVGAKIGYTF